jgi:hypothetical protein
VPENTNAGPAKAGAHNSEEAVKPARASGRKGRRHGRSTTYVQESYRLREVGKLRDLTPAAREAFHYFAHLLDRFARDDVVKRQEELAAELGYTVAAIEKALRALRRAGLVEAEAVHGSKGYRDRTRFALLGMPEAARWYPSTGTPDEARLPGQPSGQENEPTRTTVRAYPDNHPGSSVGESLGEYNSRPAREGDEEHAEVVAQVVEALKRRGTVDAGEVARTVAAHPERDHLGAAGDVAGRPEVARPVRLWKLVLADDRFATRPATPEEQRAARERRDRANLAKAFGLDPDDLGHSVNPAPHDPRPDEEDA